MIEVVETTFRQLRPARVIILLKSVGWGVLEGTVAGGLYGWMLALFHPFGLLLGGFLGALYGLIAGLLAWLGLAFIPWQDGRVATGPRPVPIYLAAALPIVVAGLGLAIVVGYRADSPDGLGLLLLVPSGAAAVAAAVTSPTLAGVRRRKETSLPPGPLAGPWTTDDESA